MCCASYAFVFLALYFFNYIFCAFTKLVTLARCFVVDIDSVSLFIELRVFFARWLPFYYVSSIFHIFTCYILREDTLELLADYCLLAETLFPNKLVFTKIHQAV